MTSTRGVKLTVEVKAGRLDPKEWQKKAIGDYLTARGDKPVVVEISKPVNSRSDRQNKFYWAAVIGVLAAETLNNPDDIHIYFRETFLPRKFITLGKREVEVPRTTTDLTVQEFSVYLKQCAAWAASELGINLDVEV